MNWSLRSSLTEPLLDDTHRAYRQSCVRFAKELIAPQVIAWEEAESFPRELYGQAAAAGVLAPAIDERYGGAGGDALHALVGLEGLMCGGSMGVVAGLGSLGIALPPILLLGDETQKQRFVPPVARGEKVAALAITEPEAGSDVAGLRLRAVRDGDGYRLNGTKVFITSGARADLVTTLARTGDDAHGGLTFFVVEREMSGFAAVRTFKKTGWRASDTAELAYHDVWVPLGNRLGQEGTGFATLMQTFAHERLALAFMGHASAELALEAALAHSEQRRAFGRPLTGFQVTRHKLAQMATDVAVAKAFNTLVARSLVLGQAPLAQIAMAKNVSATVAERVCREAVQLHGGTGYLRETLVERLARDVRLLAIGGGTTEVMNEIISRLIVPSGRKG